MQSKQGVTIVRHRFFKIFTVLASLALILSACAGQEEGLVAPPAPEELALAEDTSTESAEHNEEEAAHEEDADHDEAEADHEEDADHDEAEADHDESEADHDESDANQDDPNVVIDRTVEVELNEFNIEASDLVFAPGETVEFVVTNSGFVEHELRLSNQARVDEHLEGGHDDHDDAMTDEEMAAMEPDEEAHGDDDHGDDGHDTMEAQDVVLELAAGESGTLVFTFPDNESDYTAAVCLIPDHYEAGMAVDILIDA